MWRIVGILFFIFFSRTLPAQQQEQHPAYVWKGDTVILATLPEVVITGKIRNPRQRARLQERNLRLVHNVRKALPFAKEAARRITEIEARLAQIPSGKEQNKLIKKEYDELIKTFKKPLMQLTVTQGRILVRLVYRETQKTSFAHIRHYKGGVNAQFWQTLALLFGNNLKAGYDPDGADYEIERIVRELEAGRL